MNKIVIIGTGSFATEVANLVGEIDTYEVHGFIDTRLKPADEGQLEELPVFSLQQAASLATTHLAVCALGTTHRIESVQAVAKLGYAFATLIHPSAQVPRTTIVGAGTIIGPGVIIGHRARIDDHVILNRGALIGHHTHIGPFSTVSPGANIAAKVEIGERCYIGMGAIVLDGRRVETKSVVGAGAVVTRDVPSRVQVTGIPAHISKQDINGI